MTALHQFWLYPQPGAPAGEVVLDYHPTLAWDQAPTGTWGAPAPSWNSVPQYLPYATWATWSSVPVHYSGSAVAGSVAGHAVITKTGGEVPGANVAVYLPGAQDLTGAFCLEQVLALPTSLWALRARVHSSAYVQLAATDLVSLRMYPDNYLRVFVDGAQVGQSTPAPVLGVMRSYTISRTEAGHCKVFVDGQHVWGGDVLGTHFPRMGLFYSNVYPGKDAPLAEIAQIKITSGVPVRTGNYTPTYPLP